MRWVLGDGVIGVLPDIWGMKAEDDMVFRDTRAFELVSDTLFGSIALDPHFVSDDIDVNDYAVDAPLAIESEGEEQVAIVFPIEHGFALEIAVGIWNCRILDEDLLNDGAVVLDA